MLNDQDSRDPLNWLSRILWPDGSTIIRAGGIRAGGIRAGGIRAGGIRAGGSSSTRWWASPSAENPKILIPAGSSRAARTSVKRYHDGFSTRLRLRSLAAESLMAFEPMADAALRRSLVGAAAATSSASVGRSVVDGIAELLGVDELHVAVSLSTPKSNQKPVLQLLDRDGNCLGWAKVAWNERTAALVANEAAWLGRRADAPLSMPRLLHDVEILGRRVAISSAVEPSRRPRRRPARLPAIEVFAAVAALGTVETVDLRRSPWWRSVEDVLDHATDRERSAILATVESCTALRFQIGAWHGDLTPWNLMTAGDRVHLIDWEFAADGVPLGFDLCHFHTQVASEMKVQSRPGSDPGHAAARAIDYSARLSPQGLAALGVAPENRLSVWRLYLVELVRRHIALRANGYPTDQVTQGPAALDRLDRVAAGPDRGGDAVGESRAGDRSEPNRQAATLAEFLSADCVDGYTTRQHQAGATAR